MILSAHLLTGAAIASKISNPFLAVPLVILSHYFLDCLPQEEYSIENIKKNNWGKSFPDFCKVFSDIFFGMLMIFIFSDKNLLILITALPAAIPDSLTLLHILFPQNKLMNLHHKFHKAANNICDPQEYKKIPAFWGIFSQVAIILTAILVLRQ